MLQIKGKDSNLAIDTDTESGILSRHLFTIFKKYSSREFIFVEPGGNFGDYLIYKGAQKLANLAGIKFRSVGHQEFIKSDYPSDAVTYIHGGGGFNPWWSGTPILDFRKAVGRRSSVVILGPTTSVADPVFLRDSIVADLKHSEAETVHVLARDRVSLTALRQCLPGWVELGLDHDTALNLSAADFRHTGGHRLGYTLYSIREDKEAAGHPDRDFLGVWVDPISFCHNFDHWLGLHRRAKRIVTNRLHSAIAGVIFGVPTTILQNNYHKNRSVWEYSLRQQGVQWSDGIGLGSIARAVNAIRPLRKVLESPVFQRALRAVFYGARYRNLVS